MERAAAQVCREAGGRVGVDRFVRDLDLGAFNQLDARIEVIVDGLSLWRGAQLAVDHCGVTLAWRRFGSTEHSNLERCGFAGSTQGKGDHVP